MKNGYDGSTPLQIERPVYQIEELNRDHLYEKPYSTSKTRFLWIFVQGVSKKG